MEIKLFKVMHIFLLDSQRWFEYITRYIELGSPKLLVRNDWENVY